MHIVLVHAVLNISATHCLISINFSRHVSYVYAALQVRTYAVQYNICPYRITLTTIRLSINNYTTYSFAETITVAVVANIII